VLILAFDTATDVATSALVDDGESLGERTSSAKELLVAVDALLRTNGVSPADLDGLAVGVGPGSFTSTRIGLALARGLGLALGIPAAGVSTLDALAAGAPGALPVIDARRREVFVPGPRAVSPAALELEPGTVCVGDGAVRYRAELEVLGAVVPPDDDPVHRPRAVHHVRLATSFGSAAALVPVYVRVPDADRVLT
jgi:tRNA threonylcarbamoyladenosine biosynthesis protein TsaB